MSEADRKIVARMRGELPHQRVTKLLEAAGWRHAGGRSGSYLRFAAPHSTERTVVVPLDPDASDYAELLGIAEFEANGGQP